MTSVPLSDGEPWSYVEDYLCIYIYIFIFLLFFLFFIILFTFLLWVTFSSSPNSWPPLGLLLLHATFSFASDAAGQGGLPGNHGFRSRGLGVDEAKRGMMLRRLTNLQRAGNKKKNPA